MVEVKGHVYGEINGQKYEFPVFAAKITHAHTVCTRPFLLPSKGLGTRLSLCVPYGTAVYLLLHVSMQRVYNGPGML